MTGQTITVAALLIADVAVWGWTIAVWLTLWP